MKKKSHFLRFLAYVGPYKHLVLFAALGGIVKFTVPLLVPQATRYLVDHVYLNAALTVTEKVNQLLLIAGGLMAIFIVFWMPWTYVRHYAASKAGQRSVYDLRVDLYDRVLRMSASFFNRHKSGGIVSRLMSDVSLAQDLVGNALTNVWMDATALVFIIIFMMQIDITLTLVSLATFPIYIFFYRNLGDRLKSSTSAVQKGIEAMSGNIQEKVAGANVVRSFTQEDNEGQQFEAESDRLFSKVMRTNVLNAVNQMVTGGLTNIAPLIVALYGGYQTILGHITVGELVAIGMYLGPLYLPLQRFSELNVVFSNSTAALTRIFEIMDEEPEVAEKPDAHKPATFRGSLEFKDVRFSYNSDQQILNGLSFKAEPGQKVALVGHSGSGKSTIISLIPRFYDTTAGTVLVDDREVRDLPLGWLRGKVGMVLQDPILFSGSVRDNIRYGKPEASEEEIVTACKNANALDFILKLPKGLESEVGERGNFLSGGQKQRLTIARAFLKDPGILILDEATSALDTESERLIQEALDRLMQSRTTVIIAHRLSTIIKADQILVLHDGRIVESGNHASLLERNGVYATLYERQGDQRRGHSKDEILE